MKKRKIFGFAWVPTKTLQGWTWLTPVIKNQEYKLHWVDAGPETKAWQQLDWITVNKTLCP